MDELPLHDIIPPESINPWPPAIGWWLLLLIVVLCALATFIFCKRFYKKWAYRKEAIQLLNRYFQDWQTHNNTMECCQKMAHVLKRVATTAYPASDIQALHGDAWVRFLNQQTRQTYFTQDVAEVIKTIQYQEKAKVDLPRFHEACLQWIKHHSVDLMRGAS